jgi:hypothetical protein
MYKYVVLRLSVSLLICTQTVSGQILESKQFPVGAGWAKNQINTVIFRRNSIVSHGDEQYVAFYDSEGNAILAKRKLRTPVWKIQRTQYVGDVKDAHKSISIVIDGTGYLHMVWNQHDSALQYCRSIGPNSLNLTPQLPMLNDRENRVTYPEFYNLANGDLLFLYRDGSSGRGNLVINRYYVKTRKWSRVQNKLIDGEDIRGAYWQAAVDSSGTIHLSWVWRETADVASNHDLCYAKSPDGGISWQKSSGETYQLPITAASAEYVVRIPQHSDLINQTSMTTDSQGRPYLATYWRSEGSRIPQYQLVYHDGQHWQTSQVTERRSPFTLEGLGTRRIPISRPQVLINAQRGRLRVAVVFRDAERADRISVATTDNLQNNNWKIKDLTETSVGMWEPTHDPELWRRKKQLHLFVQTVGQGEAEGLENIPAKMISVLEWKPIW